MHPEEEEEEANALQEVRIDDRIELGRLGPEDIEDSSERGEGAAKSLLVRVCKAWAKSSTGC